MSDKKRGEKFIELADRVWPLPIFAMATKGTIDIDGMHYICDLWRHGVIMFSNVIHDAVMIPGMAEKLAKEFEVAQSTVVRWARGVARPHPRIQKQIVYQVEKFLSHT